MFIIIHRIIGRFSSMSRLLYIFYRKFFGGVQFQIIKLNNFDIEIGFLLIVVTIIVAIVIIIIGVIVIIIGAIAFEKMKVVIQVILS